ncbi:unnamed protein product [Rotaria socialis]|uniref:Uncharacterized protein n=2 Tax=Rotaria socialis TaxID=392032 RepID=A0A820TSZ4_9BILA|nr:unnamed protein product [Rotaria socialis]
MEDNDKNQFRRWFTRISLILILTLIVFVMNQWGKQSNSCRFLIVNNRNSSHSQSYRGQRYLAYIITSTSPRFNATYTELTTALPKFFKIIRKPSVSHTDSRIVPNNYVRVSSLLLTHIDTWHEIGSKSDHELGENDWVFVFEDDVGIVPPAIMNSFYRKIYTIWKYAKPNPILGKTIEEGLKLAKNDGILYLGACGPVFMDNDTNIQNSRNRLIQFRRGVYFCTHAIAYTKWRTRRFWSALATYRLFQREVGSGTIAREWQRLSKAYPFSAAANIHWPPNTGHYGFFYQTRGNHPSIIQEKT